MAEKNSGKQSRFIEAEVSVKGLAFTLKRRPFFEHAHILMEIARPFSKISPIGKDIDISGVLDGSNVRLEDKYDRIISKREDARRYFPYGRRLFFWDDLDMAYFANYAFWNYFTLPNLLMDCRIDWAEPEEGTLKASFPDNIPTHSKEQEFKFDKKSGLLLQHNYTAEVISKLATAAHIVTEHKQADGLVYPSSRVVTPMAKNGNALKRPVLIDIKLHSFKLKC
jgi:hypothetical protein